MLKVSMSIEMELENEKEAEKLYLSLKPDYSGVDLELHGCRLVIKISNLRPSRARALANSILRLIQLREEIVKLTRT